MSIDLDQLKQLASDPNVSTRQAFEKLGFNNYSTFDYHLKKDPEAERIWHEGRDAAAGVKAENKPAKTQSQTATPPKTKPSAHKPPPRTGHTRNGANKDLLKKVFLEFSHIDIYGEVSEHFDELREEIVTLI